MSSFISKLKVKVNSVKIRILKWRISSKIRLRKATSQISYYTISILGAFLAAALYHPLAQNAISKFKNIDVIFLAAGGMIGTMLALVFSLSIIPIQRAAETFTPSIIRLYRDDRITQFIFFSLAALCLISFIFAIDEVVIGLQSSTLLPIEIMSVAISLDLLRWHYRRIIQLLEPSRAIPRLLMKIKGYIYQTKRNISGFARLQQSILSEEQKAKHSLDQIESSLYVSFPDHSNPLKAWIGELAEISHKAVAKNETHIAELAISAMAEVACYYLDCRKNNLRIFPSSQALFLASDSDVAVILTPVYEHLKDINRSAVAVKAETTCIHVVKALGVVAIHTASLKARAFFNHSAPLTFAPMYYLQECVALAQRNNLDDVALQGSHMLLRIAKSAPDNIRSTDIHLPAIDEWYSITLNFLLAGKGSLSNEVLRDLMELSHHLLERNHFRFVEILHHILEKLTVLAPLAVAHEKTFGSPVVGLPCALPYDLGNPISMGYLVQKATTTTIKKVEGKEWVNPYGQFIEINEVIYRHLRDLAEKVDFGSSFLLWHIIQTIRHIAQVYLGLLRNPITDNPKHLNELVQQVPWYEAFYWVVFSKSANIDWHHAREASDFLAWIGIAFYDSGYAFVAEISAGDISSIANSYCKVTKNPDPHFLADLLISIWHIKLLAEIKGDTSILAKICDKIDKPKELSAELWAMVQAAFERRKQQLEEKLQDLNMHGLLEIERATGLLKKLLEKEKSKNA
jgi:hypothetical protein